MPDHDLMTDLQHLGEEETILGAVVQPVFQNSTFVFKSLDEFWKGGPEGYGSPYYYSRVTNPTVELLQKKIARVERAEMALVFGSGMAAISAAIFSAVSQGSHIVCEKTSYGPTRTLVSDYLPRFGVTHTFVDGRTTSEVIDAIRPETKLVYLESPGSLVFHLQDLAAIASECRSRGIVTAIDNTYGITLQHPFELGIDLSVHSATKYIGGHSDVVAGVVTGSAERLAKVRKNESELFGSIIAPLPAAMMVRGLRTLPMRLERMSSTANVLAAYLSGRPEIAQVIHVGLPSFPQAGLRDRQMSGSASIFSIVPKTTSRDSVRRFVEALDYFQIGVSWGGHESLVVPTLASDDEFGKGAYVIRFHCGFEAPADLIADLERCLPLLA